MTDFFAINGKQNIYVDTASSTTDSNRIGNALNNGSVGTQSLDNSNVPEISSELGDNKRTQADVESAISKIISGTGLTLDEAKKLIDGYVSLNKTTVTEVDTVIYQKILFSLSYAIKDCTVNGKLDKEKLNKIFGCYLYLSTSSDKKEVNFDDIRMGMKMSLVQFIKLKNPELRDKKEITAQDIKNTLKTFIKQHFTAEKIEEYKNKPAEARNIIKSLFGLKLENCTDAERKLLFEAFVLLLKEEDSSEYTSILIGEVAKNLKENPEKLQNFINNDIRPLLKNLGFDDKVIERLINLGLIQNINADNIEGLLNEGIKFLKSIDSNDLSLLLDALEVYLSNGELTKEQAEIMTKYKDQLSSLVNVIVAVSDKPELMQQHNELFAQLQKMLEEKGLDKYVYQTALQLYQSSPQMFENLTSLDDFIKNLNKLTNNKFGEVIGDKNPDNLYKADSAEKSNTFGFEQNNTSENFLTSLERRDYLKQNIINENQSDDSKFLLLTEQVKSGKSKFVVEDTAVKYQSLKSLSAKDLFDGLSNKDIDIDYVLDNYKDLSHSAKLFVNKLIEIMSPAEQNFRLDGMPNSEAIDIIKHSNINPEDLKLALDFASRKELEKLEENRVSS